MGQLVYILGKSGTGKSFSMRNFPKEKFAVINVQGKILPFKGAGAIKAVNSDQSYEIVRNLIELAKNYKSIVIDDYQYTMANEFMRRSAEKGYDKFTEIGRHAWDIANAVRELPNDVIVYIMCHTDRDDEGNEKIKTIGKLLDEKICLEGMSTIVLKTNVTDGVYTFLTQNSGKDTVKSPAGMFPTYAIENDLYYVDQKIRNYYELGEFITDEEAAEIDEAAKKVDIEPGKKKSRRSRANSSEAPAETPQEAKSEDKAEKVEDSPADDKKAEDKPKRARRTRGGVHKPEEPAPEGGFMNEPNGEDEELPESESQEAPAEEPKEEPAPATRRRRRRG